MRRRLTLKHMKLIVICLILFIFYVSYKIIQPDIGGAKFQNRDLEFYRRHTYGKRIVNDTLVNENVFISRLNNWSVTNYQQNASLRIKSKHVVKELVEKYRLDWGYQLKESPWKVAASWVTPQSIHPEDAPELGAILKAMATRKILSADVGYKGTQLKLTIILDGDQKALFKPKWFSRDHVIEGSPYAGADRHNGEIAAFHLSRLLEFRRTPLAVGRVVNLETEILPVATTELRTTFFKKDNSTCFYGKCHYCRGEETGVCGEGPFLEGAVVLWLPGSVKLNLYKHPWARTYRKRVSAEWEKDNDYCKNTVLKNQLYSQGPLFLDLIDIAVFDYLIGNADRHHFETLGGPDSARVLLLDNAKSFGNPHADEQSILAPLYQCCRIRESTWLRLLTLDDGILSKVLQSILESDPISPVINTLHFQAMDRRLSTILNTIRSCVFKYNVNEVLIKDR